MQGWSWSSGGPPDSAQNSLVRFYQDPETGEFTHPVAYLENGSHELYPSEFWSYYGAPNHNGQSYHYLSTTPPNLGEVDWPLDESPFASVIIWFNGLWGAYGRFNTPPPGPAVHQNWTLVRPSPSDDLRKLLRLGY